MKKNLNNLKKITSGATLITVLSMIGASSVGAMSIGQDRISTLPTSSDSLSFTRTPIIQKESLPDQEVQRILSDYRNKLIVKEISSYFYDLYGDQVFKDTIDSQTEQMSALKEVLDKYSISIPALSGDIEEIVDIYKKEGKKGLKEALEILNKMKSLYDYHDNKESTGTIQIPEEKKKFVDLKKVGSISDKSIREVQGYPDIGITRKIDPRKYYLIQDSSKNNKEDSVIKNTDTSSQEKDRVNEVKSEVKTDESTSQTSDVREEKTLEEKMSKLSQVERNKYKKYQVKVEKIKNSLKKKYESLPTSTRETLIDKQLLLLKKTLLKTKEGTAINEVIKDLIDFLQELKEEINLEKFLEEYEE